MKLFPQLDTETKLQALKFLETKTEQESIIFEKDFWVTMVLKWLFEEAPFAPYLYFRGGTSLSKGYGIIQRFSEDIDIALDPHYFAAFNETFYPTLEDTASKRSSRMKKWRPLYRAFMQNELEHFLEEKIKEYGLLDVKLQHINLEKARDPWVLLLHYRPVTETTGSYVQNHVKIELSGRAKTEPFEIKTIQNDTADLLPALNPNFNAQLTRPTRTFWEKCFLLHEQNSSEKPLRQRQARHYFDLAFLIQNGFVDHALFEDVKTHRRLHYDYGHVDYDAITPASLHVLPQNEAQFQEWKDDYENMSLMIYGDVPSFENVIQTISDELKTWS